MRHLNIPDHPEIACALATGYPHPVKELEPVNCTDCGTELAGEDEVFIYDGEPCCENCCRTRIDEDFFLSDIAKALQIPMKTAADYAADKLDEN